MTAPVSPPSPLLALRSHGMVTAIGNSAAQTVASWIAEVRRTRRVTLDGFADPFTIADCHAVTAGLTGVARLAPMLVSAVVEALDGAVHLDTATPGACLEILLVPTWLDDAGCESLGALLSNAVQPFGAWTERERTRMVVRSGSAGAWVALEHAYRALAAQPELVHVMVAAVDSACEPAQLLQAAEADWLLRKGNAQGYVAGEGAACVLLQRAGSVREVPAGGFALHRPALVQVPRLWPDAEPPDPGPLSQALATALRQGGMAARHISHLQSDMDGSDWRAALEGSALNRVVFATAPALPHWLPAALLGHAGNSSGIVGWLLLAILHQHDIEHVNTVLNWSVDPAGEIAACVLERSPHSPATH